MTYLGFHSTHVDSTDDNFDVHILARAISLCYIAQPKVYVLICQSRMQNGFYCFSFVSYTKFDSRKKHAQQLYLLQCKPATYLRMVMTFF